MLHDHASYWYHYYPQTRKFVQMAALSKLVQIIDKPTQKGESYKSNKRWEDANQTFIQI